MTSERLPVDSAETPLSLNWLPLFIAILTLSAMMAPVTVVRLFSDGVGVAALPAVLFVIALESAIATVWLAHPDRRSMHKVQYRAAELVFVVLLLRLITWQIGGFPSGSALLALVRAPLTILDPLFMTYIVLGLLTWERAAAWTFTFTAMRFSYDEAAYYELPLAERSHTGDKPIYTDRAQVVAHFTRSWLAFGAMSMVFVALSTVDLPALGGGVSALRTIGRLNLPPSLLLALVVYYVLGFWLLSRARFHMFNVRWRVGHVDVDQHVQARWQRGSAVALVLVALVASFLPIGSTFGAARILYAIVNVLFFAANVIIFAFITLLGAILSLFGRNVPSPDPPALDPIPLLPPPAAVEPVAPGSEALQIFFGSLVWIGVGAVVIAAVLFFLRQQGYINFGGVRRLLAALWQQLRAWWHVVRDSAETLTQRVSLRRQSNDDAAKPASRWRYVRVNELPPREQIRFFYLSAVRRAEQSGVKRQSSETPLEFADDLKDQWPDAEIDVDQLTDAFLHAQYSPRPVAEESLNPVKQTWKRVRSSLRRRRKKRKE